MSKRNPKIDQFMSRATDWREEMVALREICLDTSLTEEMKWGKPCYAWQGSNICIIQPFKKYMALMFFKGVLLNDDKGLLSSLGERTRSAKQLRFTSLEEIRKREKAIRSFIEQAIEIEKSGAKVDFEKDAEIAVPDEFQAILDHDPNVRAAFEALTPGRQRGYLLHFSDAKQSKTRASRVEKAIPQILEGKGLRE